MKPMKHFALLCIVILLASCSIAISVASPGDEKTDEKKRKGQLLFDYPDAPEPIVEINLTEKLIGLVTKSMNAKSETAELIEMISGIYVRVYDNSHITQDALVAYYEKKLKAEKWEVLVKINTDNEKLQIRLLFDKKVVSGIFIMENDSKSEELTLVNIIGDIDTERIGELLVNLGKVIDVELDLENKKTHNHGGLK